MKMIIKFLILALIVFVFFKLVPTTDTEVEKGNRPPVLDPIFQR